MSSWLTRGVARARDHFSGKNSRWRLCSYTNQYNEHAFLNATEHSKLILERKTKTWLALFRNFAGSPHKQDDDNDVRGHSCCGSSCHCRQTTTINDQRCAISWYCVARINLSKHFLRLLQGKMTLAPTLMIVMCGWRERSMLVAPPAAVDMQLWWEMIGMEHYDVVLLEWIFLIVFFAFIGKMTLAPIDNNCSTQMKGMIDTLASNGTQYCNSIKYRYNLTLLRRIPRERSDIMWVFVEYSSLSFQWWCRLFTNTLYCIPFISGIMKELKLKFPILLIVMWTYKMLRDERKTCVGCEVLVFMVSWWRLDFFLTMTVINVLIKHRNTVIIVLNLLLVCGNQLLELFDKRWKCLDKWYKLLEK